MPWNDLKTRDDAALLLLHMVRPLRNHYSRGRSWLHIGSSGAHYGEKSARMEGFSRVLWGLGPLFAGDFKSLSAEHREEIREWEELYRQGIIHGTDPEHEEYWGEVADYDQKMVEMAAIVTGLLLAPEKLWIPLTEKQKKNLWTWFDQINQKGVHPNNWRFFRILVNVMFRVFGLPWSEACMEEDFRIIEKCYDGDGWYFDGNPGQVDYYIPFAMHYYGLLYAGFMKDLDGEYGNILKDRAGKFWKDFIYWFAGNGAEIPFGRSLIYRFAHGSVFSAMAFAGVEGLDYGVAKGLALGNVREWLKRPVFDGEGILSIGYGYPNLFMSERYNAPGSPYWAFKTFLMLALPETHPFWRAEEKVFPYEEKKLLPHPRMLITHDKSGHVLAYPAGQHCMEHGNSRAKYEKFVYSNQFGFSVSRGTGLEDGAFDCTLAVSESGENCYRMRYGTEESEVTEEFVRTVYRPMKGVRIESFLVPFGAWHVRIHEIETDREIDLADGGFSIGIERCFTVVSGKESGKYTFDQIEKRERSAFACFPWGTSGIVSLDGGEADVIPLFPNTNLFYNMTVLPTVKKRLRPGKHQMITCVLGDMSPEAGKLSSDIWETMPKVRRNGEHMELVFDGKCITI
ncbi:DUF2264 domain-containing protein [Lachnospiraceae bacterium 54-53]